MASITIAAGSLASIGLEGKTLTVNDSFSMGGGVIEGGFGTVLVNNTNNATTFAFTGGEFRTTTLSVGNSINNPVTATWTGGRFTSTGVTFVPTAVTTIDASPANTPREYYSGILTNYGAVTQNASIIVDEGLPGNFQRIYNHGSWLMNDAAVNNWPGQNTYFANYGQMSIDGTSHSSIFTPFDNDGTVTFAAPNILLRLGSYGTHTGMFQFANNTELVLEKRMLPASTGHNLFANTCTFAGPSRVGIAGGSVMEIAAGAGDLTIYNISLESGNANPSALLFKRNLTTQHLAWASGRIEGANILTLPAGGTGLVGDDSNPRLLKQTRLRLNGALTWVADDIEMQSQAAIEIANGGRFDIDAEDTIKIDTGPNAPTAPTITVANGGTLNARGAVAPTIKAPIKVQAGGKANVLQNKAAKLSVLELLGGDFDAASATVSIDSLTISGGTFTTLSSALTLGDAVFSGGTASLAGGSLAGTDLAVAGGFVTLDGVAAALSGALDIDGGTVAVHGGTADIDGGVDVASGAALELSGGGTLVGDLLNAGLVSLGSRYAPAAGDTFVIDGAFTQLSGGLVFFDLSASAHDLLDVTGVATLAGTVQVGLVGSSPPAAALEVLTYGSRSGSFSTLLLPPALASWTGRYDDPLFLDAFSLWPGPGGGIIVVGA